MEDWFLWQFSRASKIQPRRKCTKKSMIGLKARKMKWRMRKKTKDEQMIVINNELIFLISYI